MAESSVSFIQKCFEKWLEENPDGTYSQFILLCETWLRTRIDDKQKLNSLYGKFMKTPKQMFEEGWCKDCLGDNSKCLKKGVCEGNEKNIQFLLG